MVRASVQPAAQPVLPEHLFDAWYREYHPLLRAYAARLVGDAAAAEDVVQETFARAWQRIDVLRERDEIGPWLYRVVRNLCVDRHRRARHTVAADLMPADWHRRQGSLTSDDDPSRAVERAEEREAVRSAFSTLTARHRDVLFLADVCGESHRDVAARAGLSDPAASRAVLARARRRLRDELKVMGQGLWGGVAWVRLRVSAGARRALDRAHLAEPIAGALAQCTAAAVVAAGLIPGVSPSPAQVVPVAHSRPIVDAPAAVEGRGPVHATRPVPPVAGVDAPAPGDVVTDPPAPTPHQPGADVDVTLGPDALPPNPYQPHGQWAWLNVGVNPEHAGSLEPYVVEGLDTTCEAAPGPCTGGGPEAAL